MEKSTGSLPPPRKAAAPHPSSSSQAALQRRGSKRHLEPGPGPGHASGTGERREEGEEDEAAEDGVMTSPPRCGRAVPLHPLWGIHGWSQPAGGHCWDSRPEEAVFRGVSDGKTSSVGQGQQRGLPFNSHVE